MNTSLKKVSYPLIVSDFDGTLVANHGDIPQENKETIAKYCEDGGRFVISTGRMHYAILPRVKELGLKGFVSCAHGSLIMDTETGETLLEGTIPTCVVVVICKKMEELGLHFQVYAKDEFYSNTDNERLKKYEKVVGVKAKLVVDKPLSRFVSENGICAYRVMAFVRSTECMSVMDSLSKYTFDGCVLTKSDDTSVEVINASYSKGTALKFLADYFKIPLKKTIAVGDQWNDISMIVKAGLGFAVKNADEKLKEQAIVFDCTNEEGAVAKIIKQYAYEDMI
jgi:Cof subfamily protein (haloacid dehalogenase superfamily)